MGRLRNLFPWMPSESIDNSDEEANKPNELPLISAVQQTTLRQQVIKSNHEQGSMQPNCTRTHSEPSSSNTPSTLDGSGLILNETTSNRKSLQFANSPALSSGVGGEAIYLQQRSRSAPRTNRNAARKPLTFRERAQSIIQSFQNDSSSGL